MIGFVIRIVANIFGFYAAYWLVPGFIVTGGIKEFALGGALLGLLNMTVRPFLRLISMPLIILSLGFFSLVINALLLWLVDFVFDFIKLQDIWALILATIVISIVNIIASVISKTLD